MSRLINMNFCTLCGDKVAFEIPSGDNMPRHVCQNSQCGFVHYQNPKVVAGCIVLWGGEVLLCRRAIEPRSGLWTIPAGFMENGETVNAAAVRETLEEACAAVEAVDLFAVYNIPRVNQVYVIFSGSLTEPEFSAGVESLDVRLFPESEIPWEELAFPVVTMALRRFFVESKNKHFRPFVDDVP